MIICCSVYRLRQVNNDGAIVVKEHIKLRQIAMNQSCTEHFNHIAHHDRVILKRLFPDSAAQLDETRILNKLAAGSTVFHNLGGGRFEDVSAAIGPFSGGWSWGGGFVDFDNDGWLDLHSPNGFVSGKSLKDT